MYNKIIITLILLVLLFYVFDSQVYFDRFEYKIEYIKDNVSITRLLELGKDGWEVVNSRRATDSDISAKEFGYEIIFKRKIKP